MIRTNMTNAIKRCMSFAPPSIRVEPDSPVKLGKGIPTLEKGVYRDFSPMLLDRFTTYGRWLFATHGVWLGLNDMEKLWDDAVDDEVILTVKNNSISFRDNWADNAYALFKDCNLSLFAGGYVREEYIFLLWLELEEEPEFWIYDANGEARYKDFNSYLDSYLNDDLSAFEETWRAQAA